MMTNMSISALTAGESHLRREIPAEKAPAADLLHTEALRRVREAEALQAIVRAAVVRAQAEAPAVAVRRAQGVIRAVTAVLPQA